MNKALQKALVRVGIAESGLKRVRAAAKALVNVSRMQHASMCPANRCTCDLDDTRAQWADNLEAALRVTEGEKP
jgi:hypothetical protein